MLGLGRGRVYGGTVFDVLGQSFQTNPDFEMLLGVVDRSFQLYGTLDGPCARRGSAIY